MNKLLIVFSLLLFFNRGYAQQIIYPYPVQYFNITNGPENYRMAFMDVSSKDEKGKTILLLHGKNFNGFYWKDIIPYLNELGYRVIVPDQLGFGASDKPNIHYSFHELAWYTSLLLDSLNIENVTVMGHSMGGMLATRFALMYPYRTEKLILENPIGLEDYRTFVPYVTTDSLFAMELNASYDSYKRYQQTYYPDWKPEYEQYVKSQAAILDDPGFPAAAWVNALTFQMIYEQPVCYEFNNLTTKTLIVIGALDQTIVGKSRVPVEELSKHGQYTQLGKWVQKQVKGSLLEILPGIGHIPHIQDPEAFKNATRGFLKL